MMSKDCVLFDDGKYKIIHHNEWSLTAERYGEYWRELTGDTLILALLDKISSLQDDLAYTSTREIL